jgi:RNA polymerase sigma-70 factor (ECF subfamily)
MVVILATVIGGSFDPFADLPDDRTNAEADTSEVSPPSNTLDAASFPGVLVGARAGDQWAAEALFVDLQPRLLRFLRSVEPRVADDLAGEVWLAIAQGLAGFDGDLVGFRSWVFTIARRRLADHRRSAGRRATDPVDPHEHFRARPDPASVDGARADTATAVIGRLSAQEAVDLISGSLPADQAEVLLLRVLGDLDVAHVAAVMERTPNWVRVTQHRALRKLAEKFSEISADL